MRMNFAVTPRTPRPIGAAAKGARPGSAGRVPIAFLHAGTRWQSLRPVDRGLCQPRLSATARSNRPFATFELPRVASFLPRVGLFSPHVGFSVCAALSLFLINFLERRERERGPRNRKRPSTSPKSCKRTCPRVRAVIHGFSVDEKRGTFQCWCGLAADSAGDPRSTRRNAGTPCAMSSTEGSHHGR